MDTIYIILKFIFGVTFLIKGADYLIQGSISLANRLKISKFVVGVLIISFGTSFPELIISVFASLKESDNGSLILGNVIGSNISNILFILGISSIITPIFIERKILTKEVLFNLLLGLFLIVVVSLSFSETLVFPRWSGIVLLGMFIAYNIYLFSNKQEVEITEEEKPSSMFKIILSMIIGIVGLSLGGDWLINSSIYIAEEILNVNKGLVGLTVIAFGTSLPELVSCIIAARKKETGLILGGIFGSNMFNVLIVLGTAIVIKPIYFAQEYFYDLWINLAIIILLIIGYGISPKHYLKSYKGWVLLMCYISYIGYTVITKGIS